jgi:hypothetical protein
MRFALGAEDIEIKRTQRPGQKLQKLPTPCSIKQQN